MGILEIDQRPLVALVGEDTARQLPLGAPGSKRLGEARPVVGSSPDVPKGGRQVAGASTTRPLSTRGSLGSAAARPRRTETEADNRRGACGRGTRYRGRRLRIEHMSLADLDVGPACGPAQVEASSLTPTRSSSSGITASGGTPGTRRRGSRARVRPGGSSRCSARASRGRRGARPADPRSSSSRAAASGIARSALSSKRWAKRPRMRPARMSRSSGRRPRGSHRRRAPRAEQAETKTASSSVGATPLLPPRCRARRSGPGRARARARRP